MATKDKDKKRAQQKRWYETHKDVHRANVRRAKQETIEWFADYKAKLKCSRCPEDHPACIEFHHRDPSDKDDAVSVMVASGFSRERIMAEVAKCDPLCANCHRKLHWSETHVRA